MSAFFLYFYVTSYSFPIHFLRELFRRSYFISSHTPPSIFGYVSLDIRGSCFTRFRPSSLVLVCLYLEITQFTNPGAQEHANIDSHCIMNTPWPNLCIKPIVLSCVTLDIFGHILMTKIYQLDTLASHWQVKAVVL